MRLFKHLCLKVNHDGVVQSCTQTKAGFITGTRYFEQNDIFFFNTLHIDMSMTQLLLVL